MKIFKLIKQLIKFIGYKIYDFIVYIIKKEWTEFPKFGITVYVGMFGKGKTMTMVEDCYKLCRQFNRKESQVTILTNIKLERIPKNTRVIPFINHEQIINAPSNTIILLDEISTLFNSRNWKSEGISPQVLGIITQVRKHKKYIMTTAQRFAHVDKMFRDLTFTVRVCNLFINRWQFVTVYDAWEYERAEGNRNAIDKLYWYSYIQTNKMRLQYDTSELVDKLSKEEYISTEEYISNTLGGSNLVENIEPNKIRSTKTRIKKKLFGGVKNS